MLLTPYASDAQDEKTQAFTKAYEDKYGDTPIQFAADAYDAIYAIKAAAEEAECNTGYGLLRDVRQIDGRYDKDQD